jgi:tRNA(fMet)-specific endonuclease VapC
VTGNDVALDTSVVILHLRNEKAITGRLKQAGALYLSVIAMGELYYGAHMSSNPGKVIENLKLLFELTIPLFPDGTTSAQYGQIKRQLARHGTPIPENDIWIAALAMQYGLPLAARDDHFSRVAGLTVLKW